MGTEPEPTKTEPPKQKFLPFWTLLLVGAVLVVILLGAIGFGIYWVRSEKRKIHSDQEAFANQTNRNWLDQAKAGEAEKVALAQSRQQEVLAQLKAATNGLARLLESVVRANTEAMALRTNDAGRAVAQFPELVSQARRIRSE